VLMVATSYAYAQADILPGNLLYPMKRLGEQVVVISTFDNGNKALLYQSLADQRLHEAELLIDGQPLSLFISIAHAESPSNYYVFASDKERQIFINLLREAQNWSDLSLVTAQRLDNDTELAIVLNQVQSAETKRIVKLNGLLDRLGLESNLPEVAKVMQNISQTIEQKESIRQAIVQQQQTKQDLHDIIKQLDLDKDKKEQLSESAEGLQNTLDQLDNDAQSDNSTERKDKLNKIRARVSEQIRLINLLSSSTSTATSTDEEDDQAIGHARALETYGLYVARERTEHASEQGQGDKQGLPFIQYQQVTDTPSSTPPFGPKAKDRQNEDESDDQEESD